LVLFGANYQHPDPLCAKNLRRGHAICRNGRTSENAYPKEQGHLGGETKHHATKVQNPGDREGEEGKREQEAKRRREKRKRRKRKRRKKRRRKERKQRGRKTNKRRKKKRGWKGKEREK
jgi:hypothetical protein